MNERHQELRAGQGLALPFGMAGVAAVGALALALLAFFIPREWIESIAFQLYLDQFFADAVPPFGTVARIVTALALGLLGAGLGYGLARLFGVTATPGSLDGLLARVRGDRSAEDEEDAPWLRAADRHPDAPARRPLSAARDIPAPRDDADLVVSQIDERFADVPPVAAVADFSEEDEDELVLDTHYWADDAEQDVVAADAMDEPQPEPIAAYDFRNDDGATEVHGSVPMPEDADFDLPAPSLADWEEAEVPAEIVSADAAETVQPAEPVATESMEPARAPLDLSVARLDELLARLEAGLARRDASAAKSVEPPLDPARDDEGAAEPAVAVALTEAVADPAFPQDPALAAALATLRRLNQQAS